jgi:hypothetical protein
MQSRRLLRSEAGPPAQAALRELAGPLDMHLRAALELLWAAIFVRKTGAGPPRAVPPKGEALPAVPRTDAERRAKAEAERREREHGAWEVCLRGAPCHSLIRMRAFLVMKRLAKPRGFPAGVADRTGPTGPRGARGVACSRPRGRGPWRKSWLAAARGRRGARGLRFARLYRGRTALQAPPLSPPY